MSNGKLCIMIKDVIYLKVGSFCVYCIYLHFIKTRLRLKLTMITLLEQASGCLMNMKKLLQALEIFGINWPKITKFHGTRTPVQVKSRFQKLSMKYYKEER